MSVSLRECTRVCPWKPPNVPVNMYLGWLARDWHRRRDRREQRRRRRRHGDSERDRETDGEGCTRCRGNWKCLTALFSSYGKSQDGRDSPSWFLRRGFCVRVARFSTSVSVATPPPPFRRLDDFYSPFFLRKSLSLIISPIIRRFSCNFMFLQGLTLLYFGIVCISTFDYDFSSHFCENSKHELQLDVIIN